VLFHRDAGALQAYLVDAETAERYASLSDGQRHHDLLIATENVAGELFDLGAADRLPSDVDPVETAEELERRDVELWDELTRPEEVEPGDRRTLVGLIRRLNDMGFDVEEFEVVRTADGGVVRVTPRVLEEATRPAVGPRSPVSRCRRTRRVASSATSRSTAPGWPTTRARRYPTRWPPTAG
jgi:hypothetical protein